MGPEKQTPLMWVTGTERKVGEIRGIFVTKTIKNQWETGGIRILNTADIRIYIYLPCYSQQSEIYLSEKGNRPPANGNFNGDSGGKMINNIE